VNGDLTTWEKAKSILNLEDDQRELIEFLISAASSQAEKIAGRVLAARDVEITLDADGREYLLPSYPVNETCSITVNETELQPGEYSVKEQTGILRLKENARGWDAIVYKGNIGYNPVPEDLQQAVIEMISANIRRFATSGGLVGIKSLAANGAVTTQYELDIPVSSRSVFMSYRGARI
jgi:hypothetical protein